MQNIKVNQFYDENSTNDNNFFLFSTILVNKDVQ